MTFTIPELTVVFGLLLISPTLCVLAVFLASHEERRSMKLREQAVDAQEAGIEAQKVAIANREEVVRAALRELETQRIELKRQSEDVAARTNEVRMQTYQVAAMAESEIDQIQDETQITPEILSWEDLDDTEHPRRAAE